MYTHRYVCAGLHDKMCFCPVGGEGGPQSKKLKKQNHYY